MVIGHSSGYTGFQTHTLGETQDLYPEDRLLMAQQIYGLEQFNRIRPAIIPLMKTLQLNHS